MTWRGYYRMPDGRVLRDSERHSDVLEAMLWHQLVAAKPEGYYFHAKNGETVEATEVIPYAAFAPRAVRRASPVDPVFA
jgi:hypothetical protein